MGKWSSIKNLQGFINGAGTSVGHKVQEGDGKTPEGHYYINDKHPSQKFQKFLNISYPNEQDKINAMKLGVSPGGSVGIHGDKGGWGRF